jgi:glutaredoxin
METPAKKARLYGLSTCPVCKRLREFLEKNGVEFENIDVDTLDSGEQWVMSKELKKHNPGATYPTLVVEEVITEYDEEKIKKALGLK